MTDNEQRLADERFRRQSLIAVCVTIGLIALCALAVIVVLHYGTNNPGGPVGG